MQQIDPFKPILNVRGGKPPLVINIYTKQNSYISEGVPMNHSVHPESYVLLSELPTELRQRVILAIEAMRAAY